MAQTMCIPATARLGRRLLMVDDDEQILELLSGFLEGQGYDVSCAKNGHEMRDLLARHDIDLVILDLKLPGEDGLTICKTLRAVSSVPIIILTAMSEEIDRIVGLELGADDYLAKPCSARELLARIKSLLRRMQMSPVPGTTPTTPSYSFDGWVMDCERHALVAPNGNVIELSVGEVDLMMAFLQGANRVLTRDRLMDQTRGRLASPIDRAIDVQISRLRRKLEEAHPSGANLIKTVRGAGYMFTSDVRRS